MSWAVVNMICLSCCDNLGFAFLLIQDIFWSVYIGKLHTILPYLNTDDLKTQDVFVFHDALELHDLKCWQ